MRHFLVSLLFLSTLGLSGCNLQDTAVSAVDVPGAVLRGVVHGGQQPVVGATVYVYSMGSSNYGSAGTRLATTTTDSVGSFAFGGAGTSYTCPASNTPLYIYAIGSSTSSPANANLVMAAALGPCMGAQSETVYINEVTTAAFATAYAQFMSATLGSGAEPMAVGATCSSCAAGVYNRGLVNSWYAYQQLVNNSTGNANVPTTSGSLTVTTEPSKLYSIANVLASCVNSTGETSTSETTTSCGELFHDVYPGSGTRPYDTLQAALEMALAPYYNVSAVYDLALPASPFSGLGSTPNDWTLGVSYTTTTLGLGIEENTTSNLDIDTSGNIWFPSNKTGAIGIASFSPSTTTFSAATGMTGLVYPQYIAVDTSSPAYAWTTDLASGSVLGVSTTSSSTYKLTASYASAGPIVDLYGNSLLMAGYISGGSNVFEIGTARSAVTNESITLMATPNALAQATPTGNAAFVSGVADSQCQVDEYTSAEGDQTINYTGASTCFPGGMVLATYPSLGSDVYMTTNAKQICDLRNDNCVTGTNMNSARGIAVDGSGAMWVANSGNGSILSGTLNTVDFNSLSFGVTFTSTAYLHGSSNGGTMTTPYGIAVDGSGNIWVSNASCVATSSTLCSATSFTLSEVIGVAVPAYTPYAVAYTNSVDTHPSN